MPIRIQLSAVVLAGNGYTIRQITAQAEMALTYAPDFIVVLAGTNDLLDRRSTTTTQDLLQDYAALLDTCGKANATIIVTLVPYTADRRYSNAVDSLNAGIRLLAEKRNAKVIDLNPLIAASGSLESQYTVDGVHFSKSAYTIWRAEIRRVVANASKTP